MVLAQRHCPQSQRAGDQPTGRGRGMPVFITVSNKGHSLSPCPGWGPPRLSCSRSGCFLPGAAPESGGPPPPACPPGTCPILTRIPAHSAWTLVPLRQPRTTLCVPSRPLVGQYGTPNLSKCPLHPRPRKSLQKPALGPGWGRRDNAPGDMPVFCEGRMGSAHCTQGVV